MWGIDESTGSARIHGRLGDVLLHRGVERRRVVPAVGAVRELDGVFLAEVGRGACDGQQGGQAQHDPTARTHGYQYSASFRARRPCATSTRSLMVPVFKRLPLAEQQSLMSRIVARCKGTPGQPSPVVVFDLDGTLMDNRPRTLAILQELAARPEEARRTRPPRSSRPRVPSTSPTCSVTRCGSSVSSTPSSSTRAESFWKSRFFSDDYLKHDVAIEGSVEFAKACYEAGAVLVYFTGRDLPLMGLGSFQSLRDLGFPIGVVGTELVCKPDAKIPDELFKREEGPKLLRVGRVVAAFDNEPGNCNAFREMNPEAEVVFVDTQHLPGAPPLDPARAHRLRLPHGLTVRRARPSRRSCARAIALARGRLVQGPAGGHRRARPTRPRRRARRRARCPRRSRTRRRSSRQRDRRS